MEAVKRLANAGVVPVVVIEDAKDAIPAAEALLRGGIDVMEVTLRTAAGVNAITAVAKNCAGMLVGAGTIITLEQCRQAVEAGAKFIVSPGFNREMVKWCVDNGVVIIPGCVTPTEIMQAMEFGLKVLKFFPADVYGGLPAMKALFGPFSNVKFIPTGGINAQNLSDYIAAPYVFAIGGSWICSKKDIADGNFDKITALCAEARRVVLGFEVAHVGLNLPESGAALEVAEKFGKAFGFEVKPGNSSNFAGSGIEVMKSMYLGDNGHIAIRTNDLARAIAYLQGKGFEMDVETAKYKGGDMVAIYLKDSFGGFAVHLLKK